MMLKRFGFLLLLACALVAAAPVHAAAQQTFNFTLGGFVVSGDDAREDDVLNENRNFLVFDVDDFNGAAVGAEWLVPVGQFFEAGAGLSFYRRTVPSVYEEFVDRDGSEIEQDLRLRIVPLTATVRVLPLAQRSGVQPYFGVGVGVFNWRYSEAGEFVDFTDNSIFREEYVASGNEIGPVALGGIRFAGDTIAAGFEIRYQDVKGELDDRFSSDRIDLGGWTYNFTLGLRF